jgi:hypothetical protein
LSLTALIIFILRGNRKVDVFQVMEALLTGVTGKIIDVTAEDGEHVEQYVEQSQEFNIGA